MGIWSWNDIPIYNMGITFPYVILESHSHISYGNIISICIMQNVFYYFSYYFVTQPLLFKSVQNSWPCLKLNLHAPATPRAQSECIARFARTFSIGTPRATSPRGCFEGLLRTLNTRPLLFISVQNSWPCLKLNHPRRRFAAPAAPRACNATHPVPVATFLLSSK